MLLLLGELAQPRRSTARASSSSPSSTSASTSSGATGKTPGSSTPSRSRVLPDRAQALGRARRLVREQRGDPAARSASSRSQRDAGRLRARRAPPPPTRSASSGRPRPAASSARQRSYIGQISSSPLGGLGPLVEQARGRVPLADAQLELAQVQPLQRVRDGSPRSSASASRRAQDRARRADLAPPDEPLARDPLRRVGDVEAASATRRGSARRRRRSARRAGRAPSASAYSARRSTLGARRAGVAGAAPRAPTPRPRAIRSTRMAATFSAISREHGRPQRGRRRRSRRAPLEVPLDVVVALGRAPLGEEQPRADARCAPAGATSSSGVEQVGQRAAARPRPRGSRRASSSALGALGESSCGVSRSACSASSTASCAGAARAPRSRRRPRRSRRAPRPAAPRPARGAARAARSSATTPASVAMQLAPLGGLRARRAAAAASSGCDARTRSPSTTQHARVDRALERRRLGERTRAARPEVGAQRHREQELAHVGRQAGHARAQQVLDVVRERAGRRRSPARRRPRSLRPTSSANSGLPSVASTSRRSTWRGRVRPSRSERSAGSRRGSAVRPRRAPGPSRSSARSSGRTGGRVGGRAGSATGSSARRRDGEGERLRRRRGRATGRRRRPRAAARAAASARSASSSPSAIACASGGAPVGCARRSATSSACRCGGGSAASSSSSTPSSRSISAANESRVSASLARAASTRRPRPTRRPRRRPPRASSCRSPVRR